MSDSIWILGRWTDLPSGANWELTGAFRTRQEAIANGRDSEFVARLPVGIRTPEEITVLPDAEWIADISTAGRAGSPTKGTL